MPVEGIRERENMSGDVTEARSTSVGMEESKAGSEISGDTLVVLEFSSKAPAETKEWLMALIRAPGVFLVYILKKNSLWFLC